MHNAWGENPGKQPVDPRGYNGPSRPFSMCPKSIMDPTAPIFPRGRSGFLATMYMSVALQC